MANFVRYGNVFFTQDDSGGLKLVEDPETSKALKAGHLPYKGESITRGLQFGDQAGTGVKSLSFTPQGQTANTQSLNTGGTEASTPTNLESLFKQKFLETLQGLTSSRLPGLEARQRQIQTQMLTAPAPDTTNLDPGGILRAVTGRGQEYAGALDLATKAISEEKAVRSEDLQVLSQLATLTKYLSPDSQERTTDILNYEYAKKQGFTGDFTQWQVDEANRKAKASGAGLTPYQTFQGEQTLANNFRKNTENAREVSRQFSIMKTSIDELNEGRSNLNEVTQAIIRTYNLILEPESVVREAEYALTSDGQSLLRNLDGKFAKISAGGSGVTKETLQDFVKLAEKFYTNVQGSYIAEAQRIKQVADSYGMNLKNILTASEINAATTGKFINTNLPKDDVITAKDGTVWKDNGDGTLTRIK